MRFVSGFLRFWWDFIVGDDWRIAAGVTVVLAAGAVVEAMGLGGAWLAPTLAVGFAAVFTVTLIVAARPAPGTSRTTRAMTDPAPRADPDPLA